MGDYCRGLTSHSTLRRRDGTHASGAVIHCGYPYTVYEDSQWISLHRCKWIVIHCGYPYTVYEDSQWISLHSTGRTGHHEYDEPAPPAGARPRALSLWTEKCQFWTENCQFWTEKCQFWTQDLAPARARAPGPMSALHSAPPASKTDISQSKTDISQSPER
jgi:hypothetical protein